ncbi:hypothetical protein Btru_034362 [Bulinus truncatus]|nr:hypothetical protein Btru_034362 [Bulinus truncatus]
MHSLPLFRNNMAAKAAKTVLKTVKPHVPLIKFPQRNPVSQGSNSFQPVTSNTDNNKVTSGSNVNKVSISSIKGQTIDSCQLPLKYRRKTLTHEEIDIIERGGCTQ